MIQGKIKVFSLDPKNMIHKRKKMISKILTKFKTFSILKPVKRYVTDRKKIVANYLFDKLEHVKNIFKKQV